ncbi:tetratricopeptide repeat protein [Streptomyces sp. NBC_00557]|uniref:tetratricopeptide repeat protein n=1 Tax=Streptomyces sp. NBC_00557 TaxID=2975776 RepID=UPI002E81DFEF|nr:tetratricopeptide repeat protein [Streptomyces sp. NBC_00557]WUC36305.1 hypothetical protein OG956_19835 [Streptomyces sp. NBC_00557]
MAQARPSMQELIGRRRRAGFIGRGDERAAFRANLDLPPEDERHRFLFHIHGHAGVGKTFLARELEQIARERGALTAYVDESTGSVPEAMAAICREFTGQGREFRKLERALASYRERRHEAEAVAAGLASAQDGPSPVTATAVRAGLAGLGLIPGAGPFVGAVDPAQVAQYADRLRRGLSARFSSQDDVQLVLSPERALTPRYLDRALSREPDYGWALGRRGLAALDVGRTERALADLDRCIALDADAPWARAQAVRLLIRCGRWPEALERLAEADLSGAPDTLLDELRAEVYRHDRQWAAAERVAERMRSEDPFTGTFDLALAVSGSRGLRPAVPLWQEVGRLADTADDGYPFVRCVLGCALGEWGGADVALAGVLAEEQAWDDLALLAAVLIELLSAPGADRARVAPRLSAVVTARDAVQARYAE